MDFVYVVDSADLPHLDYTRYINLISEYKRDRIRELKPRSMANSIVSDLLIRYLLELRLKAVRIAPKERGKPELWSTGHSPSNLQFNLSHSGSLIACVLGSEPVGVDVEKMRVVERAESLAKRFFSFAESKMLNQIPDPEKSGQLLRLWTLKESFFKMCNQPLNPRKISFAEQQTKQTFEMVIGKRLCFFEQLKFGNYFVAACGGSKKAREIKKIKLADLINYWETRESET
ncbi:MAG: 4'-phosphopantetheinyl transferase superfamily protein [Oscillospiraceae bacterium]|jgi:4'-phosphopantetheinyl transferase|nr:4'-phosphopantetheinyl transferase superfamily protein [Oscillospiraceae bacterium]